MDRLQAELEHHDAQARSRREHFHAHPEQLHVHAEQYLNHASWIRPALARLGDLGDVRGKHVLDFGCGHGMASVVLARRGARVTAFDLSGWYVAEARERVRANGVEDFVQVVQASGEQLPFSDQCFDAIWGNAILHHLDLHRAGRELARVLRPDGVAVFCEPWGENPLLEWARRRLPYREKARSRDERPLCRGDLQPLFAHFDEVQCEPQQLFGMVQRVWPGVPLRERIDRLDARLFRRWPRLARFCRYMIVSLRRPRRV
jgi:2-polyprenyl-3-methyl-5-hydroxy-6-metoxy-1,4-benzoquinol methylase